MSASRLLLDVQAGAVMRGDDRRQLTARQMQLIYWMALEAPPERIGLAVTLPPAVVADEIAALCETLRLPGDEPIALDYAVGQPPSSRTPWAERTVRTTLRRALSADPDRQLVLVAGEGALTVGEVRALIERIAAGLLAAGVTRGTLVALDATQRLESYLVALAAIRIGAIAVRLGDSAGPDTLRKMVALTPSHITFTARSGVLAGIAQCGRLVALAEDAGHGQPPAPGAIGFEDWLDACPDVAGDLDTSEVSPTDPALVGFTSGSTGEPKAVYTPHEAVFRSSEAMIARFAFASDDVFACPTDISSLTAFRFMTSVPLAAGARVLLPSAEARRQPVALALECEQYSVTQLNVVPHVLRTFAKADHLVPPERFAALRTAFTGTGMLDRGTARRFTERFGVPIVDFYGAREVTTIAYCGPGDATVSAGGGEPCETLVRVLDEHGAPVRQGETGEITIHTDCHMMRRDNSLLPADGWYRTGDLGSVRPSGSIEIVGRSRDIIKTRDGNLVSPAELESVLNGLPFVREASVFGYFGPDAVERVGAAIVEEEAGSGQVGRVGSAQANGDSVHEDRVNQAREAIGTQLGEYKVPAEIIFLEELPRVALGKPDKSRLRQLLGHASLEQDQAAGRVAMLGSV